jgi:hypothetical protein
MSEATSLGFAWHSHICSSWGDRWLETLAEKHRSKTLQDL